MMPETMLETLQEALTRADDGAAVEAAGNLLCWLLADGLKPRFVLPTTERRVLAAELAALVSRVAGH